MTILITQLTKTHTKSIPPSPSRADTAGEHHRIVRQASRLFPQIPGAAARGQDQVAPRPGAVVGC